MDVSVPFDENTDGTQCMYFGTELLGWVPQDEEQKREHALEMRLRRVK